jgi:hypothetical protein
VLEFLKVPFWIGKMKKKEIGGDENMFIEILSLCLRRKVLAIQSFLKG